MSKRIHILGSACNIIGGLIGLPGWLLRFARPMLVPKAVLAAKLLAAESPVPWASTGRLPPLQAFNGGFSHSRPSGETDS